MKLCTLFAFCIGITTFTSLYTMTKCEKQELLIWLKTKDKKIVSITVDEQYYSSHMMAVEHIHHTGQFKEWPLQIDMRKKEIQFFQYILHRPTILDKLSNKQFFKALTIAAELKSPLLYAEILNAKLPANISAVIAQKCISLTKIHNQTAPERLMHIYSQSIATIKEKREHLWNATLQTACNNKIKTFTLPQAALLMMPRPFGQHTTYTRVIPHMPGYDAFMSWNDDQQDFLLKNFPLKIQLKETKTGTSYIAALYISV